MKDNSWIQIWKRNVYKIIIINIIIVIVVLELIFFAISQRWLMFNKTTCFVDAKQCLATHECYY